MSHVAAILPIPSAPSGAGLTVPRSSDLDPPPFWSPARIDTARRLWSKGLDEADILVALNKLPGAQNLTAEAITALAWRLRWPGPKQPRLTLLPATRDGAPSIAERQAAELARAHDHVELPMEDAVAWGRANGVGRGIDEPDTVLLVRINRARAGWRLPRFRVTRRL